VTTPDDLSCREVVELVTDWLEGALPAADHARVELHLAGCEGCAAYVEQMRATVRIAGRLDEEELEPVLSDELVAAFRGWRASSA
jgi:anti-sigma factor RsiW